jgi:pimeloyl-ACP methyl ester carboxylesterase
MAVFKRGDVSLYYEEFGSGFPLLLFAPGALESRIEMWHRASPAPIDPTVEFASEYRVIAMDQRNAGQSTAPISGSDGWHTYAEDHVALLDHLGADSALVMGACIGVSFALRLVQEHPDRVPAAVLQQPIGSGGVHEDPYTERWRGTLPPHPEATEEDFASFRENMFGTDFVHSVSREFVRSCTKPFILLAGNDDHHPRAVSDEIARSAPNIEYLTEWKQGADLEHARERLWSFLRANTPIRAAR